MCTNVDIFTEANAARRKEKLTSSNKDESWSSFSSTEALGEDPSSDSSKTGEGGLAGM